MTLPSKRVQRQILCTFDAPAAAIAERVVALSHCGMCEPPLAHVPAAATEADADALGVLDKQIEAACDRLADLEAAERQRAAGLAIANPDELHIWLLLNLTPETPLCGDPAGVAQLQAVMARSAWRRLRAHVAWHAVLLLEAAAQDLLVAWVAALHAESEAQIYVMSPVNAQHLRMAESAWTEQVAQSVAALLWTAPPAHSQLAWVTTDPHTLAAVAACVWCSPAQPLHGWLAQAGAARVLQLLGGELAPGPGDQPQDARAHVPAELPNLSADLAALQQLAPAPPELVLPPAYPSWPALAKLPGRVEVESEQAAAAYAAQSREVRLAWLDAAQSAWDELLQGVEVDHLVLPAWPRLRSYRSVLAAVRSHLHAQAQGAGERLEAAGERLERATREADAALRKLKALCAGFPSWSPAGALAALLQPWRWLPWAYAYWQELPNALHASAATQQEVQRRRHEEATWHTLRQHYLAAAQQAQLRSARLQQLAADLAAAEALMRDAGSTPAAIPAPWTPERLTRLQARLLPDVTRIDLAGVLRGIVRLELAPGEMAAALQARVGAEIGEVAGWSALDCLATAFAVDTAPGDMPADAAEDAAGGAPVRWLEQQLHASAPLWPAQELAENALGEEWWSAPEPQARPEWSAAAAAVLAAWRSQFAAAQTPRCALDAVLVVRWAEVRADLEASEGSAGEGKDLPYEDA